MSELQLSEFKEWFTKKYTYSAEYFALAHFDVGRGFFTTNDMYNPDATNAAWVLRASFGAWNHQQAIIDEHTEVIKLQDADLRKYEKQIESLKAQLNNMEQCYIQLKQINNEQAEIIRGHFSARQEMKKCIDAALYDIAQAKDGFYGYSSDGGDVDNLTKNIEKSLRGER